MRHLRQRPTPPWSSSPRRSHTARMASSKCAFLSLAQGSLLDSLSWRVLPWVKFDSMSFHLGPALTPCSLLPLLQCFSNIYLYRVLDMADPDATPTQNLISRGNRLVARTLILLGHTTDHNANRVMDNLAIAADDLFYNRDLKNRTSSTAVRHADSMGGR